MIKDAEAVCKHISQGVYVISVANAEQKNAFTAAWVMQVSFDPLLLCFSINPEHYSYKLLQQGGVCCISVLEKDQYLAADHFAQSNIEDKMAGYQWKETDTKALALADSLAYFDCQVEHYAEAGDHKLVVCKVIDAAVLNKGEPMLYADTGDMDESSELY